MSSFPVQLSFPFLPSPLSSPPPSFCPYRPFQRYRLHRQSSFSVSRPLTSNPGSPVILAYRRPRASGPLELGPRPTLTSCQFRSWHPLLLHACASSPVSSSSLLAPALYFWSLQFPNLLASSQHPDPPTFRPSNLPPPKISIMGRPLMRVCVVGGNAISAFLSWRLQATTSCDVTLVWKSGFENVAQYGVSFKYVCARARYSQAGSLTSWFL